MSHFPKHRMLSAALQASVRAATTLLLLVTAATAAATSQRRRPEGADQKRMQHANVAKPHIAIRDSVRWVT